jgi:hypothetical protein
MGNLPAGLAKDAEMQHGVFSRKQALAAGLTDDAVRSRVRRKTWRRLYAGVYCERHEPLSRISWLWAATLYAGTDAVLSHETAAELNGIGKELPAVHVSVPGKRRVRAVRNMRVHRTHRVLDPPDGHRDPPHTSVEETLLDLAQTSATLDDAIGWITKAFARGLTDQQRLLNELKQRTAVRWRGRLLEVIEAGASGDYSVLEYRYTRDVEQAHGLPDACRQVPFTKPDGRRGYRDRVYEDHGLVVELDGKLYHKDEDKWAEEQRDRAAMLAGLATLRFGWSDVNSKPCATASEVFAHLRQRGWAGKPRRCSPNCPVR